MSEPLERLFLREKPVLALLAVGEMEPAYASLVAKRIDSTFPHTSRILSELETHGLIKSKSIGRIRYLELTDRGESISRVLHELSDLLHGSVEERKKLDRIKQMVASTKGQNIAFCLGPLRRDLAKLKGKGDSDLEEAIQDLDEFIVAALHR